MKFKVRRTSEWDVDVQPCKEAHQETFVSIDLRTVKSPNEIPRSKNKPEDWWYLSGRNHRLIGGKIARDFDAIGWFIEINTLEELLKFREKYGDLVLTKHYLNPEIVEVEIYDDYRE